MAHWKFYPAVAKGLPVPAEQGLLIRFDSGARTKKEYWGQVSSEEITLPMVPVDFIKTDPSQNEWVVIFGPRAFGFTPN